MTNHKLCNRNVYLGYGPFVIHLHVANKPCTVNVCWWLACSLHCV